jgi:hypothetical protein
MGIDKYHADIRALIEREGALGVNSLSKALNVPLSTIQKYMHTQSYFQMNQSRKWDLPEKVVANDIKEVQSNFSSVIESQLTGITSLSEMLFTQIKSTITLLSAQKSTNPPVASNSIDIHPEILKLDKNVKEMHLIFSKYIQKCPEEYQELIKNVDLYKLIKEKGTLYMNSSFSIEITSLFLEKSVDLSDDVIQVLKEYQKEVKL